MKNEATIEVTVEGLDTAQVSILLVQYFAYKNRLKEYKEQRRAMHSEGKCTKGNCLTDREEGEFLKEPDLSKACDFCTKRHALFLLIKSSSAKCRGLMTRIQRHVVRMPYFKKLMNTDEE